MNLSFLEGLYRGWHRDGKRTVVSYFYPSLHIKAICKGKQNLVPNVIAANVSVTNVIATLVRATP